MEDHQRDMVKDLCAELLIIILTVQMPTGATVRERLKYGASTWYHIPEEFLIIRDSACYVGKC